MQGGEPLPVSVVIPTRDRPDAVRRLVRSILDGARVPAEIVVADQSRPPVTDIPTRDDVALVHLELSAVGLSRGRNAGVRAARHGVLVFVDDDMVVEATWLPRLVDALLASPSAVVTGAVLAGDVAGRAPSLTTATEPAVYTGRLFVDPLYTGNMAIRRSTIDEIGPFDERLGAGAPFPSAEDNDFGFRVLEAGLEIRFVPDAVAWHHGARTGLDLARIRWAYGVGQGAFLAKHRGASDRHMQRRLARTIRERGRRVPRALQGDRRALRDVIYLAGVVSGALRWRIRHGREPR